MSNYSEMALPEFQYELVRVDPSEAVQRCLSLREEGKGVFSPVILNSPADYFLDAAAMAEVGQALPKTLAAADTLSAQDFFRRKSAENSELLREWESGAWPAQPQKMEPYLHRHMEEVFIVKVPTARSYEALAHIGFGGWNDCPYDEEHVSILRYWHAQYGAELFALGRDIIECTVNRPPPTREAALNLAREQFLYAPGSLTEFMACENSVPALAAALLNSRHWLFWWD